MAKKLSAEEKKLRVEMKQQEKETRKKKCLDDPNTIKGKDGSCRKPAFYGQKDRKKLLKKSRANCPDSIPIGKDEMCVAKTFKPNTRLLEENEKKTKANLVKTAERRLDAENKKRAEQGLKPWSPLKRNDKNVLSSSPTAKTMKGKGGKVLKNPKNKGVIVAYVVGTPEQLSDKKTAVKRKAALKRFRGKDTDPFVQMSREIFSNAWANMSDGKKDGKWNLKDEYRGEGSVSKRAEFIKGNLNKYKQEVKALSPSDRNKIESGLKETTNEFRAKLGLPPIKSVMD